MDTDSFKKRFRDNLKKLTKETDIWIEKAKKYFTTLNTYEEVGWGLIGLGFVLFVTSFFFM